MLLDMFGVIITEGHLVTNITSKFFPEVDLHDQRKAYHAYERDEIDAAEYWRRIGSRLSIAESERLLFDRFQVDPGFFELADRLSGTMRFAVLSNIPKNWKPLTLEFGIGPYLSGFFASGEERLWKPGHEYFELACRRLGVRSTDCVFVDDQENNLVAASELEMLTIWVDREEKYAFPSGYVPDYRVENLGEIIDLVGEE